MRRFILLTALALSLTACNEDGSTAVVENRLDGELSVQKTWFLTTLFADAVPAGERSTSERTSIGEDYAYALVGEAEAPADEWLVMKSYDRFESERGEELTIRVSNDTFAGDCAAQAAISQEDADLVTQRIFPGEFAGFTYDAASCSFTAAISDAGAD